MNIFADNRYDLEIGHDCSFVEFQETTSKTEICLCRVFIRVYTWAQHLWSRIGQRIRLGCGTISTKGSGDSIQTLKLEWPIRIVFHYIKKVGHFTLNQSVTGCRPPLRREHKLGWNSWREKFPRRTDSWGTKSISPEGDAGIMSISTTGMVWKQRSILTSWDAPTWGRNK